jgi:hypothetical protein
MMIGWMGAMQLPGRLFFVPVAAWLGPRWVTAGVFAVQAVSLAQLPFVAVLPTLVPFVMMLGAANGMSTLARVSAIAEIFGSRHYGAISGAVALGANGAPGHRSVGASLLVLVLGSYERVFWILAGALVLVSVAVLMADTDASSSWASIDTPPALVARGHSLRRCFSARPRGSSARRGP